MLSIGTRGDRLRSGNGAWRSWSCVPLWAAAPAKEASAALLIPPDRFRFRPLNCRNWLPPSRPRPSAQPAACNPLDRRLRSTPGSPAARFNAGSAPRVRSKRTSSITPMPTRPHEVAKLKSCCMCASRPNPIRAVPKPTESRLNRPVRHPSLKLRICGSQSQQHSL